MNSKTEMPAVPTFSITAPVVACDNVSACNPINKANHNLFFVLV
jgi:hypothetical protein